MNWISLSLKDWQRRPLRTGITLTGVAIAIAALWSLLSFQRGYQDGMQSELDRLGAHILVVPKGCPYDAASIALHGATWPCYLKQSYLKQVATTQGVATAAPAFMTAFYDATGAQNVYVGVDKSILALKRGWHIQGRFPQGRDELLVGSAVAERMKWHLGQQVNLPNVPGQGGQVSGILAPTQGADDSFIYMGLNDAQHLFKHPNELTHILVRLKDPDDLENTVAQLHGCSAGLEMNVVPLAHLFRTIQSLVNSTRLLLGCIAL
ncbi:MAG: ABC transporter permease, partial [Abitibacteriaceae bacterium]|nr:ABC transporter permease [Abditibacteriaceae bacterium]